MEDIAEKVRRDIFLEWTQIKGGKASVEEYTWHHHQETGRMQLIPTDIHELIKHICGNNLWRKQYRKRLFWVFQRIQK